MWFVKNLMCTLFEHFYETVAENDDYDADDVW
jgi:hypothetical protein